MLVAPRQAAFEAFLALILAFYALGAHGRGRRSIVILVAALAVGFVGGLVLVATGNSTAGNALPTVVWAFCAWTVGRIITRSGSISGVNASPPPPWPWA